MGGSNSSEPAKEARPWRAARLTVLVAGALVTLFAVGYTIENVRGRRAWEESKQEMAAKGEVLDWDAYIPAPVSDERNIFKAPHIEEWFVRRHDQVSHPEFAWPHEGRTFLKGETVPVVAEVDIVNSMETSSSGQPGLILRFDDPAAARRAREILLEAIGPAVEGVRAEFLVAHSLEDMKTAHLTIQAATTPDATAMKDFLLGAPLADLDDMRVVTAGSNGFRVMIKGSVYSAADFLEWSDQYNPDFNAMRRALERPLARMDGDYGMPFQCPFPNFISIRSAAQILGQRAQCHILLGQPAAALDDLTLIHDLCRLLDAQPVLLVGAMIKVAVTGLYAAIVQQGLVMHAWREPQLAALEEQLRHVNLLATYFESIRTERAATCRTLDRVSASKLARMFATVRREPGFWANLEEKLEHPEFWTFELGPRGWVYQNVAYTAVTCGAVFADVDPTNNLVRPGNLKAWSAEMSAPPRVFPPYALLARRMIPNFYRATLTAAHNQTMVNEAMVACALERYRLAHHEYPAMLDALVPNYVASVPHDLIGGQSLKYRRDPGDGFTLYSIGWNAKDDAGVVATNNEEGDWVWGSRFR